LWFGLLPRNHGGVGAKNVIVIDADNSSSPYLYVDFARQYGMRYKSFLHKVIVSRQFTIYQLTNTILYDLPKRIHIHKPKIIVISGLLDQFYQDPHLYAAEADSLESQIVTALCKIKNVLIVLASRMGDNERSFLHCLELVKFVIKKEFNETKLNFCIRNNGRLKRVSMMETEITN
jgi:hypothetical protein